MREPIERRRRLEPGAAQPGVRRREFRQSVPEERRARAGLFRGDSAQLGRDLGTGGLRHRGLGVGREPRNPECARPDGLDPLALGAVVANQEKNVGVSEDLGPVERVPPGPLSNLEIVNLAVDLPGEGFGVEPVVQRAPARFRGEPGSQLLPGFPVRGDPAPKDGRSQVLQLAIVVVASRLDRGGRKRPEVELEIPVADRRERRRCSQERHRYDHG